jgi:thiamine-monophosphate kinase
VEEQQLLNPDKIPFLISKYWAGQYKHVVAGINEDDCSIIDIEGIQFVVTSDFLNSNPIAIEFGLANFFDLGRLVVASNLSDLCGSGAKPLAMMLCTMMAKGTSRNDYLKLVDGVRHELDKCKIPLIGGDTKLGGATALLGIAIGTKPNDWQLFLKNKAMPGDVIWVSGEIGSVSAAVDGYSNYRNNLSAEWLSWAKAKLIEPALPLSKSEKVARLRIGRGGTDISDGLGADLIDLCLASNVGCVINVNLIPVNQNTTLLANMRNVPPWAYALLIGGDFQFIVTTQAQERTTMRDFGFVEIGHITDTRLYQMQIDNNYYDLPNHGHEDGRQLSFGNEIAFLMSKIPISNGNDR